MNPPQPTPSRRHAVNAAAAIAVAAIVVGSFALFGPFSSGSDEGSLHALVHDSDGTVYELPLDQDAEITVTTDAGSNTVTVQDGAVFVSDADCDNHDCMLQGSLSSPGAQIICLPHKLWIEVVADGAEPSNELDTSLANEGEDENAETYDAVSR